MRLLTRQRVEIARLASAVESLRTNLDEMLEHGDVVDGGEHRDVLEAYRMFAYDRGWAHKLEEAVLTGLTAEAAARSPWILELDHAPRKIGRETPQCIVEEVGPLPAGNQLLDDLIAAGERLREGQ